MPHNILVIYLLYLHFIDEKPTIKDLPSVTVLVAAEAGFDFTAFESYA